VDKLPPIPATLAPFFQEYDLSRIDPERDAFIIIERTLQYGNRAELHWLFQAYSQTQIRAWVQTYGLARLPQPHRNFWQVILEIPA